MAEAYSFRLRCSPQLTDHLKELADRYGRRSVNTVILEILENYTGAWESAEKARMQEIQRQHQMMNVSEAESGYLMSFGKSKAEKPNARAKKAVGKAKQTAKKSRK
jgi:hypothetical protein